MSGHTRVFSELLACHWEQRREERSWFIEQHVLQSTHDGICTCSSWCIEGQS